jgi:hypothetical protein
MNRALGSWQSARRQHGEDQRQPSALSASRAARARAHFEEDLRALGAQMDAFARAEEGSLTRLRGTAPGNAGSAARGDRRSSDGVAKGGSGTAGPQTAAAAGAAGALAATAAPDTCGAAAGPGGGAAPAGPSPQQAQEQDAVQPAEDSSGPWLDSYVLAKILLSAVAASDLDSSDAFEGAGGPWMALEWGKQEGAGAGAGPSAAVKGAGASAAAGGGRGRDLEWLRGRQRQWEEKGCRKDPLTAPLYK